MNRVLIEIIDHFEQHVAFLRLRLQLQRIAEQFRLLRLPQFPRVLAPSREKRAKSIDKPAVFLGLEGNAALPRAFLANLSCFSAESDSSLGVSPRRKGLE